jgi:hypothetical protein
MDLKLFLLDPDPTSKKFEKKSWIQLSILP